jgi:tRNA G37 N-methylase Trm5
MWRARGAKAVPEKKKERKSLREAVEKKLTKKELEKLKTSFDVIGSIAILEIDKELEKKRSCLLKLF